MFALTPAGAELFLKTGEFVVYIDDFKPHGDIMAVGICDADVRIRIGDEVIISRKKDGSLVGTGIAKMSGAEMASRSKGVAVKTRQIQRV